MPEPGWVLVAIEPREGETAQVLCALQRGNWKKLTHCLTAPSVLQGRKRGHRGELWDLDSALPGEDMMVSEVWLLFQALTEGNSASISLHVDLRPY